MKKLILIFVLTLTCSWFANAQKFKTHKVQPGETIETIAKQYHVSVSDLHVLNPDSKKKLNVNSLLVIPNVLSFTDAPQHESKVLLGYETHKVKRKETLYGIAKQYNVEIEDIKKNNKRLYSENLMKGDKIRIPKFKTVVSAVTKPDNTIKTYKVLPKEGKWRVAYKFGLTVEELDILNPNMKEVLQPGDEINVPNTTKENKVDENYNYYTVQKSEGYYRLKIKLGVTQEQLESLNPELKVDGLKEGMVLKLPKEVKVGEFMGEVESTNLNKNLSNLETKKIGVMLPFRLAKINVDSVMSAKQMIKNDRRLSVSLDFYSGMLMAVDSAKALGISTRMKVFDIEDQPSSVSSILSDNDFSDYDAIIGPLLPNNFDQVARTLEQQKIPVLSPITIPKKLYENVFQTIANPDFLEKTMIDFVKADSLRGNVVVISDNAHSAVAGRLKNNFPKARQINSRKNKDGKEGFFIMATDLNGAFVNGKNYVFLETSNEGFISNVTSMLNGLTNKNQQIILVTTNINEAFDGANVSNYHLANLHFHYPSNNRTGRLDQAESFVKSYKSKYGIEPNKFAARGFDLTMDVLLRLASAEDLYQGSSNIIETEYTENKFRYSKELYGGYYNEAAYIVKYTDELTIEEVK